MRKFLKKKNSDSENKAEFVLRREGLFPKGSCRRILSFILTIVVFAGMIAFIKNSMSHETVDIEELATFSGAPVTAIATTRERIAIPQGIVNPNPFLPYRNIGDSGLDDLPPYDLVEPPEVLGESSEAARIMDTIVSGILFDKYSPSAIINIEGNDYLVKKGDVVNGYRIMNIAQDSVSVKLGNNTYKAGIGEILTEGTIHYNEVSNLNKKFGGERR